MTLGVMLLITAAVGHCAVPSGNIMNQC